MPRSRSRLLASLLPLLSFWVGASCGGGDGGSGPTPGITLTLSPTGATVQQGNSTTVTGTLTRSGGFSGAVTLSLGGTVPAGVTSSFSPAAPTGTSSTLTLTIGSNVTPGSYSLSINGAGSVGNRTTAFTLTVVAAFTLSVNPQNVNL